MSDLASIRARLGRRYVILSLALAIAVGFVLAIPTAIIDNPYFTRMTPVEPEQYVFWIATSLLSGALIATYLLPELRHGIAGQSAGAGLLGVFAVGCPVRTGRGECERSSRSPERWSARDRGPHGSQRSASRLRQR